MTNICLGRQAIYDRELKVLGYRIIGHGDAPVSARRIAETVMNFGLDKVIGDGVAFLSVPTEELSQVSDYLPKERFVIEVATNLENDEAARNEVLALIKAGYNLALSGCLYSPGLDQLFSVAKFVSFDTSSIDKDTLAKQAASLQGKKAEVIASNVASHAQFRDCCAAGFKCFHGDFIFEPDIADDNELKASRLGSMRLLAKLQEPSLDLMDLEAIIEQDVTLSYKLLRYLNSAFFALPSKIDSIKRALLMLGLRPVRNWASMIVLAGFDDKPQELIIHAMLRAKFCELLARAQGVRAADSYFTTGLLSTLDAFLNKTLDEALQLVPLSDDVKDGILKKEGAMGEVLATVLAYERGEVKKVAVPKDQEPVQMADVFLEAVAWVTESSAELIVKNMSRRAA